MVKKYKVLDLFSGLGGFSLGLERTGHFETVAFCDNDKFSKAILDKHWKGIKVYDDVREITKEKFKEDGIEFPDIITGGFPCQPFSVAGKQQGTGDDRHLWPEMFRIIKAFKPRYVIGENVRGIVNIQDGVVFETVCTNLEDEGYEVQPFNIPAAGVGAPHRRERIWFIAVREKSVVNSEYNGSPTSEIGRKFQKNNKIWGQEEQKSSREFKRTSRPNSERVGSGGTIGSEQYSERTMGREIQRIQKSTEISQSPRSNVGNSEYNGSPTSEIGRGNEEINGGTEERQNNSFELERTSRFEDNGNVSKENKNNVADTNNEGLRTRIGGSDNDHETESRSGRADGERGSSDVEWNNSTSTKVEGMDVADTNESRSGERKVFRDIGNEGRRASETRGESIQPKDRQTRTDNFGSSNSNVADTESIRTREPREFDQAQRSEGSGSTQLDGSRSNVSNTLGERGRSGIAERQDAENVGQSSKSSNTRWWDVEPNVGRVAHGVSGRVHRLKGLGNSIVPQIVEEIGKALIKATRES